MKIATLSPLLPAALLVLAARPAAADNLAKTIELLVGQLSAAAASQARVDKTADDTRDMLDEYRTTQQQIEALRAYNAQVEKLLANQKEEMARLEQQIADATVVARLITPLMLRMIDSLASFVQLDLPFLLEERQTRIKQLRDLMDRADVADSEKYRRILEAYQVENEYGRTIEAYKGQIGGAGQERTADVLRLGRVGLYYLTLDGAEAGQWDHSKKAWVVLDNVYRGRVHQALRVARKQTAPDLLTLPVPAAG